MSSRVRVLGIFVAALSVWARPAAAQIPAANGEFFACVRIDRDHDEGRLMRLVASGEPCRRNETKIHWNIVGPQGPQGPIALFSLLGTNFGGNGVTTFALPDLRAAAPNGLTYSICDEGIYPGRR